MGQLRHRRVGGRATSSFTSTERTLASTEPVTRAEAYQAFLAILNANGLTLIRRGRYHVITDTQHVVRQPTEVTDDTDPPPALDQFVTWIHRVRHMPVLEARQLLEGLRSSDGSLIPYEPTGTLIVIDTGSNIRRMRNLLFFITPHIIRGPGDLRAIFERRMRERRQFLERHMVFEGRWEPPVDYSRTRGLVSEMLDTLGEVEAEAEALTVQPDPEHREHPPIGAEDPPAEG